jgi:hypothetical protein
VTLGDNPTKAEQLDQEMCEVRIHQRSSLIVHHSSLISHFYKFDLPLHPMCLSLPPLPSPPPQGLMSAIEELHARKDQKHRVRMLFSALVYESCQVCLSIMIIDLLLEFLFIVLLSALFFALVYERCQVCGVFASVCAVCVHVCACVCVCARGYVGPCECVRACVCSVCVHARGRASVSACVSACECVC